MRNLTLAVVGVVLWMSLGMAVAGEIELEQEEFREVLAIHVERFPDLEIQDLYKLVFQAAMGAEHAVPDRESARQWLERELTTLSESASEPLTQPLSPDGALVRINLRTYQERGGEMNDLLDAFLHTAERFRGSEQRLRRYWSYVEEMAAVEEIPFGADEVRQHLETMESEGFPAIRHSASYREQYKPAYRVVLLELLQPHAISVTAD